MGRKVWVPVVSGPLAPYAAGYVVVVAVAGVFALGERRTGCISSISSAAGSSARGLPSAS